MSEALLRRIGRYKYKIDNKEYNEESTIIVDDTLICLVTLLEILSEDLFYKIFKAKNSLKTCRQLRNGIVHRLSIHNCKEVNDRFEELKTLMLYWINIIKENIGFTEIKK